MRSLFLKAKHWQLFILLTGVMIVFQLIGIVSFFNQLSFDLQPNPQHIYNRVNNMFGLINKIYYVSLFVTALLSFWYWSIATGLKHKLPNGMTMRFGLFTICLLFTPLMVWVGITSMENSINSIATFGENFSPPSPSSVFIVLPFYFFGIFSHLYCIHFTAKVIKSVEIQRKASFKEFIEEFFLLWFHFVGVWIVQPKVQKLLDGTFIPKKKSATNTVDAPPTSTSKNEMEEII